MFHIVEDLLDDPRISVPFGDGQPANIRVHHVVGGEQVAIFRKLMRGQKDDFLEEFC